MKFSCFNTIMIVARTTYPAFVLFIRQLVLHLQSISTEDQPCVRILVEDALRHNQIFNYDKLCDSNPKLVAKLGFWTPESCKSPTHGVDFIITLGGDGTVLYASWLFQHSHVPPVIPFHLGSMGFLTVFAVSEIRAVFERLLNKTSDAAYVNFRMRLACTIHRRERPTSTTSGDTVCGFAPKKPSKLLNVRSNTFSVSHLTDEYSGNTSPLSDAAISISEDQFTIPVGSSLPLDEAVKTSSEADSSVSHNISDIPSISLASPSPYSSTNVNSAVANIGSEPVTPFPAVELSGNTANYISSTTNSDTNQSGKPNTFHILNDLVIDRGPNSCMSQLELYVEGKHLTTVQADGIVVSTPTGSTAYSLSAGGSLVHPEVPSLLLTPICAHSLSFRPMMLPDSIELRIQVPKDSRSTAWASFDGRHRVELRRGDCISVKMSRFSMACVCLEDQSSDWFESLRRCLHWNQRVRQKPLDGESEKMAKLVEAFETDPNAFTLEGLADQLLNVGGLNLV